MATSRATVRAGTIVEPSGVTLTRTIAAARTLSTLRGFLTILGHMRLVPPLQYTSLPMLLIPNLPMLLNINLSMPVTTNQHIQVPSSQSTLSSLVTRTLLVTTRVLGIISILISHQEHSSPSLLFNNP